MLTNEFGRRFSSEKQFRTFYLDYLLTSIGDQKRFFAECRCSKPTINDSFMDYVIRFNGKYLPVEAKILVNGNEQQIKAQANKYVHNSSIILDNKGRTITGADCHFGKVLVADTSDLYMYTDSDDSLEPICSLNDLKTADDLPKIRHIICNALK